MEMEREVGFSGSAEASVSKSKSDSEKFAEASSSMEMISMGAPPMGDVMEWAQQSANTPSIPIYSSNPSAA